MKYCITSQPIDNISNILYLVYAFDVHFGIKENKLINQLISNTKSFHKQYFDIYFNVVKAPVI